MKKYTIACFALIAALAGLAYVGARFDTPADAQPGPGIPYGSVAGIRFQGVYDSNALYYRNDVVTQTNAAGNVCSFRCAQVSCTIGQAPISGSADTLGADWKYLAQGSGNTITAGNGLPDGGVSAPPFNTTGTGSQAHPIAFATVAANKVFASATGGGVAVPAFRSLVSADLPGAGGLPSPARDGQLLVSSGAAFVAEPASANGSTDHLPAFLDLDGIDRASSTLLIGTGCNGTCTPASQINIGQPAGGGLIRLDSPVAADITFSLASATTHTIQCESEVNDGTPGLPGAALTVHGGDGGNGTVSVNGGAGAILTLTSGDGGSGAAGKTAGAGASLVLRSGAGGTANGGTGNVAGTASLDVGATTNGTAPAITIGGTNAGAINYGNGTIVHAFTGTVKNGGQIVPSIHSIAARDDIERGTVTLSSGAGTVTFSPAFSSAPFCVCQDQGNTIVAVTRCNATSTVLTVAEATGSDTVAYICLGPH